MKFNKINGVYKNENGFEIVKTLEKKWIVIYNNETIGFYIPTLKDAKQFCERKWKEMR